MARIHRLWHTVNLFEIFAVPAVVRRVRRDPRFMEKVPDNVV
jgi:hypothetical protein